MAKRDLQRRMDTSGATVSNAAITITTSSSGGGTGMIAHELFGPYHTGNLDRTQAPWVATDIATAIATHTAIADAHHAKLHSIIDPAHHNVSGAQYSVVGLSANNVLGVLPSASYLVGNPNTLMRSDTEGGVTVATLTAMSKVTASLLDTSSGDLTIAPASTVANVTGSLVASTKVRTPLLDSASGGIAITPANAVTTATGTVVVTVGVQTPLITTASNIDLTINPGGTGAVMFPLDQTLRTTTFESGLPLITGWQINEVPDVAGYSSLTIGKIHANELMVDIFVANETRVDRGDQLWTKSYGILFANFTTPSAIGGTGSIMFEDSPAITGAIFTNNDWILLRKLEIDTGLSLFNVWGQVSGYVNNSDGSQSWTFTLRAGPTNKDIPTGSLGIDFGQAGQAFIHLSVIDPAGAPYLKLRKWFGSDPFTPSNYITYVQLGHLGSIGNSLYTPAGYGLYIRSMASEDRFIVADDNGLQLRGADFKEYNGSAQTVNISATDGSIKLGTDISSGATTAFDFNGTTGALAIKGSLEAVGSTVLVDEDGVRVKSTADAIYQDVNSYRFENASSIVIGGMYARDNANTFSLALRAMGDSTHTAATNVTARGGAAVSGTAQVYLSATSESAAKSADILLDVNNSASAILFQAADYARFDIETRSAATHRPNTDLTTTLGAGSYRWSTVYAGVVAASSAVTVGGTAVSLEGHTHAAYLEKTGGTMAGALNVQSLIPTADATYTLGSSGMRFDDLYTVNLHVDTIVGTPEFSHEHSANDITSGTLSSDRLPDTITKGLTFNGNVTVNADAAGTTGGLRIVVDQANNKLWDLQGRAQDFVTTGDRNDLFLYYYDGSTFHVAFSVENSTRVVDFSQTPTVNGAALGLASHNHDASYVPLARTVSAGAGLTGGGALSSNLTLSHGDTSAQASSVNSGTIVLQDILLDTYGHITGLSTVDLASSFNDSFVDITGDTMTGALAISMSADDMLKLMSTLATGSPYLSFYQGETRRGYIQQNDSGDTLILASEYGPILLAPGSGGSASEVLRVAPTTATITGTLGIGITAVSPLHVHTSTGSSNARFTSNLTGGTISDGLWLGIDASGGYVWNYENLPVIIATNNVSRFSVLADGDLTVNGGAIGAQNWVDNSTGWHVTYAGAADLRSLNTTTLTVVNGATVGTTLQVTTSVAAPLYTASSGDLTVSAPSTLYLNAAVDRSVDLQVAGVTQWSANASQLLPRGNVLVDIGDYNRRVRTINAAELNVETLVAQDVMATIGGRVMVAPTSMLIAETRGDQTTTLYTNLISFWALNEASGNRADSKGTNNLTDTNTVGSAAGKYSNAASFLKANSERLTINDNTSLSVGDIDFYACAWIYPTLDDGTEQTIMSKSGASSNRAWRLWVDWGTDQVKFQVYNNSNVATNLTATATILVNTWYFVEMWHDATANVIGVAVNGTSYTTAHTTGVKNDTGPFQIGGFNSALFFNGLIDEVGFWKYMPTSYERTFLYNVGYGQSYTTIASACTLDTKHNSFGPGDYVYFTALAAGFPQTEVMRIGSAPETITGGYRYLAARNLDGSAANTWGAGDALVSLGGAVGEGYIELTSTSTIHNHYGPTLITYVRTSTDTWNSVAPTTANGNLKGLVDYAVDEFGQAAGNDLVLTPATGFRGYTIDRTNGLRLFNTQLSLYDGAAEAVRINNDVGMRLVTGSGLLNKVTWYNAVDGYDQASIGATLSGGTSDLTINVNARDPSTGAFSGQAQIIVQNTVTTSSIKLLANDGSVDGPNKYWLVTNTGATLSGMPLSITGGKLVIYPNLIPAIHIAPATGWPQEATIKIDDANCSASWGPHITLGRNNNGSTPSAGWLRMTRRDGHYGDLWVDGSHVLRIGYDSGVTSSTDTTGSVVGLQVSSLSAKTVLGDTVFREEAVAHVRHAAQNALRHFTYKSGAFNGEEFDGLITDYAPRYGMDRDEAHPAGRALNVIQLINDLLLSVDYLYEKVQELSK